VRLHPAPCLREHSLKIFGTLRGHGLSSRLSPSSILPQLRPASFRSLHVGQPNRNQVLPKRNSALPPHLPILPGKSVGRWLMLSSVLVLGIVVVGGVTRLTESGLSITEWRPITGVLPPLSHEEWMVEFDKYKATPEFKLYATSATLTMVHSHVLFTD